MLIQITTPYMCAGLTTDANHRVVSSAPILAWTIGRSLKEVLLWVKKKGFKAVVVSNI